MARLRIAETFASIQGEGLLSGAPSYFVRVSGCNLRCSWCDTPYASWNPEGKVREVSEVAREVLESGLRRLVLTGGEPMVFPQIGGLLEIVREAGIHITIETAGTCYLDVPCDLMSISPKLASSTPEEGPWRIRHEATRINLGVLARLIENYDVQLKFVVGGQMAADLAEIEGLLQQLPKVDSDRILLMPEGVTSDAMREGLRRLTPEAMARGWRLCPRIHIELFGNLRGT